MRQISTKFAVTVGVLGAVFAALCFYDTWAATRQDAKRLIARKAELAMEFDLAIRSYVQDVIRPKTVKLAGEDAFIPETMSTTYVAREVFARVREKFPDCVIKFASDNPRNPVNQATPEELQILQYFDEHPEAARWAGEVRMDGRLHYGLFSPMRMEESCLRCHGRPEEAPASLLARYGRRRGFYRAVGDVIAMDAVAVPLPSVAGEAAEHGHAQLLRTALWLVLLLGGVILAFRRIVGRRLKAISQHFRAAARTDRNTPLEPIPVQGRDEIAELAHGFNTLVEREQTAYREMERRIQERIKELQCLYSLSKLVEADGATLDSIAAGLVKVLVASWQYPEITCARVAIDGATYISDKFRETEWKQTSRIYAGGRQAGEIEVAYLAEKPEADEGPFLKEERDLIEAVSERLGRIIERFRAEAALRESEERFRTLFERSSEAMMTMTPEDGFLSCNQAAVELARCKDKEEFLSLAPVDLAPERQPNGERSAEMAQRLMAEALHQGSITVEWTVKRMDGSEFDSLVTMTRMVIDGITVLQATVRDVTEKKRHEEERAQLTSELIEASRRAGMAEVATGVLHNVGNVLNSVNVSANVVLDKLGNDRGRRLCQLADLLDEHGDRLAEFLSSDERGRQLPRYLRTLGAHLNEETDGVCRELDGLLERIEHIRDIVSMQQTYGRISGIQQSVRLDELLDAALKLNDASFVRHSVEIVREYEDVPELSLDKHALLQVLVNLVSNAKHAVKQSNRDDKRITLRTRCDGDHVFVEVADNGVGIRPEDMERIFEHGFTTKPGGHGFGLHSSALAAKEIGGALAAYSDGPDCGACFCLEIPVTVEEEALCTA